MKYTNFPGTNEKVSVMGLGTWVIGGENWGGAEEVDSIATVERAIAEGVNFIDTAAFYGDGLSESLIGRVICKCRDKVFIATKCGLVRENGRVRHDLSPSSVERELDLSRERLKVDTIDLYQCHWPDPGVPVEKTMEALLRLQSQKRIRHIGVSNFDLELLKRSLAVAPVRTLQVQYSLLDRSIEKELLPFCKEQGIGIIAYGSMGGGILSGKYSKQPPFARSDARSMFYPFYKGAEFSRAQDKVKNMRMLGKPLHEVALNWVRQQPGILVTLAGCRTETQLLQNIHSLTWDLSPEQLTVLRKV